MNKDIEQPLKDSNMCSSCGAENSMRPDRREVGLDDKNGSWLRLTFDFCQECGDVKNVDLS